VCATRAGRREVHDQVDGEHRLVGGHVQTRADELVDARVGLADALDRRFDDDVEQGPEVRVAITHAHLVVEGPVVREGGGSQAPGADPPQRLEHDRKGTAALRDLGQELGHIHLSACGGALGAEGGDEAGAVELAALEPRPGAFVTAVEDDLAEEPVGEAVPGLVGTERLQWRRQHHAAEIEDDGAPRHPRKLSGRRNGGNRTRRDAA